MPSSQSATRCVHARSPPPCADRYFAPRGLPDALPPSSDSWDAFEAYGISKLSNVLHALEMGRRWGGKPEGGGVSAFAVHPGIVATSLGQLRASASSSAVSVALHNLGVWMWWHLVARPVVESVASGAASVVHAALSPELDGVAYGYVRHCRSAEPAAHALNTTAASFLWRESERLLASRKGVGTRGFDLTSGASASAGASTAAGSTDLAVRPSAARVTRHRGLPGLFGRAWAARAASYSLDAMMHSHTSIGTHPGGSNRRW